MGAGTKTAKSEARRQFPSPSSPKTLPSDLKAALKALPPPPSSPKSPASSMSLLPNGREDLMALRRETLLKFINEKDPDKKNKLEAKIDAIDRKLDPQNKIPTTWPSFVAPPPTTTSEVRGDIARLVKEASASPAEKAKEDLKLQLGIQTGGPDRQQFISIYGPPNTNNIRSFGNFQLEDMKGGLSYSGLSADSRKKLQSDINRLSTNLRKLGEPQTPQSVTSATGNTRWARNDAVDADRNLGLAMRLGDKKYDGWRDSYGSGSKKVGEGSFGTVIRNPDGTFVKRGAVSSTEAQLIKRLGEANLGPKLIAADINGKHEYMDAKGVNMRDGRIAMTAVAGSPMGQVNPYVRRAGEFVPNIYWKAMADMHRLGIAHNDAHIDNILIDDKGKGRWVDLGLAQSSPKAALAEALGTFKPPVGKPSGGTRESSTPKSPTPKSPTPKSSDSSSFFSSGIDFGAGNWQTRRWAATGIQTLESYQNQPAKLRQFKKEMPVLGKIVDNLGGVNSTLKEKYGMSNQDVADIYAHGIRSPLSSYTKGVWAKMTDQQAQELLNQLYEGV